MVERKVLPLGTARRGLKTPENGRRRRIEIRENRRDSLSHTENKIIFQTVRYYQKTVPCVMPKRHASPRYFGL